MGKELPEPKRTNRDELITLGDLHDFQLSLLSEIKNLLQSTGSTPSKQWLRSAEVRKMLGVSAGTLQTLRVNGTLPFSKMGSIVFYRQEDIIKVLEKNASR
ncbi:MAG TPA: helix-turn-helix domain-containing protein [Cyclobacteriaceae bacterium]|nr:helix-turn-helix domain-containing protein [Cyclobacteriaceae bacterium]